MAKAVHPPQIQTSAYAFGDDSAPAIHRTNHRPTIPFVNVAYASPATPRWQPLDRGRRSSKMDRRLLNRRTNQRPEGAGRGDRIRGCTMLLHDFLLECLLSCAWLVKPTPLGGGPHDITAQMKCGFHCVMSTFG
ncbi:uncharacterized protein PITG_22296, partial [Phytophthora infestans T30-4]